MSRDKIERVWLTDSDDKGYYQKAVEYIERTVRWPADYSPVAVDFICNGNYTAAVVEIVGKVTGNVYEGVGFAKRRPTDRYDKEVGHNIALRRAVKDAING